MKRERDPTPEEFEQLLDWLDTDQERAAETYLVLRKRISRVFIVRGCLDPEGLADEVLNRVAVRIDAVRPAYDNPAKCIRGFMEKVYQEYLRDLRPDPLDDQRFRFPAPDPSAPELEQEDECLMRCMGELPTRDADLFRRYFQEESGVKIKARKKLGEELGLSPNALRIKAHRIRKLLRDCIEQCLRQFPGGEMNQA